MFQKIEEAHRYLQPYVKDAHPVGVVLGSGLGNFAGEIEVESKIPYSDIPHFPVSTVEGHGGSLLIGKINGRAVVAMSGRFHFYEGYNPSEVTFPIRVMKALGVQHLLISNAAGGVGDGFKVGDLMLIKDHISFAIVNPLLGPNDERLGTRFPDMSEPYDVELMTMAREIAKQEGIQLQEGVYFGVTGPTFETRAEYKLIKVLGGDAVGMSTVQEVIAGVHAGMKVFAMSVITDIGIREEENTITHEEVLQAAREAEPKLTAIFKGLISKI